MGPAVFERGVSQWIQHLPQAFFYPVDNIALGYNVPQQFLERYQVQQLKFFFNIRNVGIWSPHWDYWDPEWDPDIGPGPTPRTFTLGIDLTLRSEEHTSEIQSLMRTSYAVFCLQEKKLATQRLRQV